jgi:hypothetical protein
MNDFDFLAGTWDIANRRRADYLDPDSEWEEFPGISHASRHFDGGASFDEITFPTKDYAGITVRLYNPDTGQWTIYWANNRTGEMTTPVTGQFKDGNGEFFSEETFNDVLVRCRTRWTASADSPRWEQAFSTDGGETWLHNWYMEFTRRH